VLSGGNTAKPRNPFLAPQESMLHSIAFLHNEGSDSQHCIPLHVNFVTMLVRDTPPSPTPDRRGAPSRILVLGPRVGTERR
jgi:hypothetical protein